MMFIQDLLIEKWWYIWFEYAKMYVVGFFLYISKNFSVVLWITSVIKNVISLNYFFFVRERLEITDEWLRAVFLTVIQLQKS